MASNGKFPRFPKPFQITAGPFVGINDTPAISAQDGTRAAAILNGYVPVPGGDVVARPGFLRIPFTLTTTGTVSWPSGGGAVTGTSTHFTTELAVGDVISVGGQLGRVTTISSDTALIVSPNGAVTKGPGATYTMVSGGAIGPLYAVFDHTRTDGTEHRFVVAGVESVGTSPNLFVTGSSPANVALVEYTPGGTPQWISRQSSSMNGIGFTFTQRMYLQTFANYLILSDGVNQPWKVDCTSAPYTLSALTDMTVAAKGRPTVYYGKLFFIVASDSITLTWSEEADPDLGYQNSSYSDSWELRQTSPEGLEAIEGTNVALYVFRENSITAITGAVNSDFASAGTQDAISTTVGTRSPDAVVTVGDSVFFLSSACQPHVIDPGRGVVPLYSRITQTLGSNPPTSASQLQMAWGRVLTSLVGNPLVVWCFPTTQAATILSTILVFDAYTRECLGQWQLVDPNSSMTYGGIIKDANGAPRMMISSGRTADLSVYYLRAESDPDVTQDSFSDGSEVQVSLSVTSAKVAGDTQVEKLFTRLDVTSENVSGTAAAVQAQYQSARSAAYTSAAPMSALTVASGFPNHWTRLTDLRGRWAQYLISNVVTGSAARPSIGQVTVEGIATQDSPTGVA